MMLIQGTVTVEDMVRKMMKSEVNNEDGDERE